MLRDALSDYLSVVYAQYIMSQNDGLAKLTGAVHRGRR